MVKEKFKLEPEEATLFNIYMSHKNSAKRDVVMKTKLLVSGILILLSSFSFANGQVGFTVGTEYGIGIIAQVGSPATKVEIGGGLAPLFLYWDVNVMFGEDKDYLKLYFPVTIGAKLNIGLSKPDEKNRLGLKLGASYNTIMKTGFGGGVDYSIVNKPYKIIIASGFMIYPKAYDELLNRLNEEEGTSYTKEDVSAALVNFQPFVSVSIFIGK